MNNPTQENNTAPQNNQPSEFAVKPPLISKKAKRRIIITFSSLFAVMVLLSLALFAYQRYQTQLAQLPAEPTEPINDNPKEPSKPIDSTQFAYIKNDTLLMSANLEGTERTRLLELSDNNSKLLATTWKDSNNITYARCPTHASSQTQCEISTLNIQNKSITQEIEKTNTTQILSLTFSNDLQYLAYIGTNADKTYLYFKAGAVNAPMTSFLTSQESATPNAKVFFTPDTKYIIYAATKKELIANPKNPRATIEAHAPTIWIYQLNGIKIDEISNATDPFLIDNTKLGYKKDTKLMFKTIGSLEESTITPFEHSYNPVISPDKTKIAYWKNEGGFHDVVLGLFDTDINIHRNIIRGIVLPTWISNGKVIGVTADKCVGQNCLLFEFQTTSLVEVDIEKGEVITVDQGKNITGLSFSKYAN